MYSNEIPVVLRQDLWFELGNRPGTFLQLEILKETTMLFPPSLDMCLWFTVFRDEQRLPLVPHLDDALRMLVVDMVVYEIEEGLFTANCSWMFPDGQVARMESGVPKPVGSLQSESSLDEVTMYLNEYGWDVADSNVIGNVAVRDQQWSIIYGN